MGFLCFDNNLYDLHSLYFFNMILANYSRRDKAVKHISEYGWATRIDKKFALGRMY